MSWKFQETTKNHLWNVLKNQGAQNSVAIGSKYFIFFLDEQKGVTINKGGSIIHESYWYKWANIVLSMQTFALDINLHKKLVQFYVRFFMFLR